MPRRQETPRPKPKMMVASSSRVSAGRRISRLPNAEWQEKAWRLFDDMSELRFASSWISNSASKVNLALGRVSPNGADPVPVRESAESPLSDLEADAIGLVAEIGGGPAHLPGMMQHLALLLSVSGLAWILVEEDDTQPTGWKWTSRSNDEIRDSGGQWEVMVGVDDSPDYDYLSWRPVADNHVLIRVWKRHPRYADQPDSPVRAVIPVLEQMELIDGHINATSKSRLAGAGVLFSPSEVEFANPEDDYDASTVDVDDTSIEYANVDGLLDSLIENASVAIKNPDDPAAVIPLPIEVPAEFIDSFRHLTFATEYSEQVAELYERGVKRFALGMDMPPEAVTGMSDATHWAAWRVAEEGVTIHIAPLVQVVTTALTINWLHLNLMELGHAPEEVVKLVVFGDITSLLSRPDKSADAISGYQELEVSGDAMRRESGLSDDDKPSQSEFLRRVLMRAMDRNPELSTVLLPIIVQDVITPDDVKAIDWSQVRPEQQTFGVRAMEGERSIRRSTEQAGQSQPTPLETVTDQPLAASVDPALVAAMDGVVFRALERAGNRLRSEAGRGVPGGNQMIASMEPSEVHTVIKPVGRIAPLVAGAFDRVAELAERYGYDGPTVTDAVDKYTRDLLTSNTPHTLEGLAKCLSERVMA